MKNLEDLKLDFLEYNYSYEKLMENRNFCFGDFSGVVFAFSEMVLRMEKPLAFSKPFKSKEERILRSFVEKHTRDFGLKYYLEKDVLLTYLFKSVDMSGRWVYIIYKDEKNLNDYFNLKNEELELNKSNSSTDKYKELSLKYAALMGYNNSVAKELINEEIVSRL